MTSQEPAELIRKVYANIMGKNGLTLFSFGVPSDKLLPLAKLNKEVMHATREIKDGGTEYEPLQGNEKLRRMIPPALYPGEESP